MDANYYVGTNEDHPTLRMQISNLIHDSTSESVYQDNKPYSNIRGSVSDSDIKESAKHESQEGRYTNSGSPTGSESPLNCLSDEEEEEEVQTKKKSIDEEKVTIPQETPRTPHNTRASVECEESVPRFETLTGIANLSTEEYLRLRREMESQPIETLADGTTRQRIRIPRSEMFNLTTPSPTESILSRRNSGSPGYLSQRSSLESSSSLAFNRSQSAIDSYNSYRPLALQVGYNWSYNPEDQEHQRSISLREVSLGVADIANLQRDFDHLINFKREERIRRDKLNGTYREGDREYEARGFEEDAREGYARLSELTNIHGVRVCNLLVHGILRFPTPNSDDTTTAAAEESSPDQFSDEASNDDDEAAARALLNMDVNVVNSSTTTINVDSSDESTVSSPLVKPAKIKDSKVVKKQTKSKSSSPPSASSTKKSKKSSGPRSIKHAKTNPEDKCTQCSSRETPEWRRGPAGPRTLCNACGLFFGKLINKYQDEEIAKEIMRKRKEGGKCTDRRVPIDI
ncbi:hypothetical protein WICPIJ_009752 [Wickerhamomyces pijperi]|uniref:GATA-type domain-containing protein n=1 Tax=Wickerhamomyces pijperi TaxID=599730 RepID=A0A9P8PLA3_WICPI|nr:hypothetical protein WICPIJ_009752 [Wickerhamomyces pijperi]